MSLLTHLAELILDAQRTRGLLPLSDSGFHLLRAEPVLICQEWRSPHVDAMLMTGDSYDCGKKMGYMQAFVNYGLRNHKEGTKFRESIKKLLA